MKRSTQVEGSRLLTVGHLKVYLTRTRVVCWLTTCAKRSCFTFSSSTTHDKWKNKKQIQTNSCASRKWHGHRGSLGNGRHTNLPLPDAVNRKHPQIFQCLHKRILSNLMKCIPFNCPSALSFWSLAYSYNIPGSESSPQFHKQLNWYKKYHNLKWSL